jgi:hypothetical protein
LTSHDGADERLRKGPPKRAYLVFFDAMPLHWCPDIGYSYVPSGDQPIIGSPGLDPSWRAVLGSLGYPTGEGFYTIHTRRCCPYIS